MRVLSAGQVIGGIGVGAALSVGGLIAEELTGSRSWAGTATTMLTLGAAVFAIPLAGLAASRGRRLGLAAGLLTAFSGSVLAVVAATAGYFPGFLLGMLVFGSGTATNLQMRFAATDLAPPATRARDLSIVVWATTVGAVAGPNLTGPGAVVARAFGLPELVGPLMFGGAAFGLSMLIVLVFLRPDPLLLAQRLADRATTDRNPITGTSTPAVALSLRSVLRVILRAPPARLALVAIAVSHAVMVSVMSMAPVHLKGTTHVQLSIVGFAISIHIAGMYALSPLVGWLADRVGRPTVVIAGQLILLVSITVGALGHADHRAVMVGLVLLGLGWSCALVAGSTLLAESLDAKTRVRAGGISDLSMNLAGASGGALSGVVLAQLGFAGLNLVAGLLTLPVLLLGIWLLHTNRD